MIIENINKLDLPIFKELLLLLSFKKKRTKKARYFKNRNKIKRKPKMMFP